MFEIGGNYPEPGQKRPKLTSEKVN
jgi:hypothetical protein